MESALIAMKIIFCLKMNKNGSYCLEPLNAFQNKEETYVSVNLCLFLIISMKLATALHAK